MRLFTTALLLVALAVAQTGCFTLAFGVAGAMSRDDPPKPPPSAQLARAPGQAMPVRRVPTSDSGSHAVEGLLAGLLVDAALVAIVVSQGPLWSDDCPDSSC